jgi:hypothetical protein
MRSARGRAKLRLERDKRNHRVHATRGAGRFAREGPMVCRLAAGGSRIRTLGPAFGTHRLGAALCHSATLPASSSPKKGTTLFTRRLPRVRAVGRVRSRLAAGGKGIRNIGLPSAPRAEADLSLKRCAAPGLEWCSEKRPGRSGTSGSNPLSSSKESSANLIPRAEAPQAAAPMHSAGGIAGQFLGDPSHPDNGLTTQRIDGR